MCFANQYSLKALLILLCYMYTFNAKHAVCFVSIFRHLLIILIY